MPYNSQYKTKVIPKESRTLPLEGSKDRGNGLDDGRYFRCWHCGFICNVDRDSLGGDRSLSGISISDYAPMSVQTGINDQSVLDGLATISHYVMELDASGSPKTITHSHYPVISGGCPLCGSMNWRGDYP